MKRWGAVLILLFSFFGLSDSIYLAQNEANNTPLICNVKSLSDCNSVISSPYAHFFGISLAEYGVAFYAFIFFLAALELVVFDQLLRRIIQMFSLVGIAVSLYLTYIEFFVIKALCVFCLASAFATLGIFAFAVLIGPVRKKTTSPVS